MTFANDYPIWILLIGFVVMGVGSFVRPSMVTAQFDIPTLSTAGRNEVRAVYGGFGILMSCALLMALFSPSLRSGICFTIFAALGGMAGGRVVSWIADKKIYKWPRFYLILEVVCATLIATAI